MSVSYSDCGVSIDRNDSWVSSLQELKVTTGGFASLWQEDDITWVSSTDGIGSKLILAKECEFPGWQYSLGQDLVAMVVNDIITTGANPCFLLDYLAVHQIGDIDLTGLILGIRDSCRGIDCFLLGGETAELPDLIPQGLFDIAGFGIGRIATSELWGIDKVQAGDIVLGVSSSGPHSNGFSLIRNIHSHNPFSWQELHSILTPTTLYVPLVKELNKVYTHEIHATAHITGGGLVGNLTRIIPSYLALQLTPPTLPPLFYTIQAHGDIQEKEFRKVLNCGVGFCLVVSPYCVEEILSICNQFYPTQILGVVIQKE